MMILHIMEVVAVIEPKIENQKQKVALQYLNLFLC